MEIIGTENLTKRYKRYKKQEGLTGSIKGLFHREYEEKGRDRGRGTEPVAVPHDSREILPGGRPLWLHRQHHPGPSG